MQIISPEAIPAFYGVLTILAVAVLFLAAIALIYALLIFHNLYRVSRFAKEIGEVLRKDVLGFIERIFTDRNIKVALASFWAWSSDAFKKLKSERKGARGKRKTTSKSSRSSSTKKS